MQVPTPALGFLANYLAELTLVDYDFLKYLPSKIAASAVFLTRWTLDQSEHPWVRAFHYVSVYEFSVYLLSNTELVSFVFLQNPTLEHYTSYKASDLTPVVLAMQDLQTNLRNCPLNSVREKYKQQKVFNISTALNKTSYFFLKDFSITD